MKPPVPQLVPLRPLPTAIVAVTAITAATVTAVASVTGTSTPAAWAVLAAVAATVAAAATLVWPRVATDVLGLHGTVFPAPADGGDLPLLGRLLQVLAATADHALAQRFMAWQRHVGFGINFQFYVFGSRTVVLVDPADVRAVVVRADPPRDQQMLRHFGTPISADLLFLIPDPHHAAARRLMHPFLSGAPTADGVLRVVNAELGRCADAGAGAVAPVAAAAAAGEAAAGPSWADRLDALAAAGTAVDLDELMTEFTLGVMHQLLFSSSPSAEETTATATRLHRLITHITALSGLPLPNVVSPTKMAAARATGDEFVAYAAKMEARRRAEYAAGTAAPTPPRDMLDIFLADLDQPGGAYEGDRRRVAADLLFYLMAGYDTTVCAARRRGGYSREVDHVGKLWGRNRRTYFVGVGIRVFAAVGAPTDLPTCACCAPVPVCLSGLVWLCLCGCPFLRLPPIPFLSLRARGTRRPTPLHGRSMRCATTPTLRRGCSPSWSRPSPPPARPSRRRTWRPYPTPTPCGKSPCGSSRPPPSARFGG